MLSRDDVIEAWDVDGKLAVLCGSDELLDGVSRGVVGLCDDRLGCGGDLIRARI